MTTKTKTDKLAKQQLTTMTLWDKVCKTDPAVTKHVKKRGGFTAVAAQSQIKRATELWGPMGDKWGLRYLEFGQIPNDPAIVPVEVTLKAVLFYPVNGVQGQIAIATDMAYEPDNDTRKKLTTDATTKALSKLGFNSDVFESKFDDNKYVEEMRKHFNGSITGKKVIDLPKPKKAEAPLAALKRRMIEVGVDTKEKYELLLHHLFGKTDLKQLDANEGADLRALVTDAEAGNKEIGFDDGGVQINDTNAQALKGGSSG